MIVVITGPLQVGKTTVCERTLALLRERGMRPAGILTTARFGPDGERTGLDVVDVATGERRVLAFYRPGGPALVDYVFDDRALRWGVSVLQRAVAEGCELLVVDELGWLELWQGEGWAWVLGPLSDPPTVPQALIVVRREVLEELAERLGRDDLTCSVVSEDNRDELPRRLADIIRPV
jgi:nucleoside-triphosphatase THEP1